MTKGEMPLLNHQLETASELDNTERIERAYKKGPKAETPLRQILDSMTPTELAEMGRLIHLIEAKNDISRRFTDPRPEAKDKKMVIMKESARLQKEFSTRYGFTFSEANQIIKERERQRRQKSEQARQVRVKREDERGKIIQLRDVIQETVAPMPPADIDAAKLAAQADSEPVSKSLWGKFKSWFSGRSDYDKFGKMAEGPVQTPVAPELEPIGTEQDQAKGVAMMKKQDKQWFKEQLREAQDEIDSEKILTREGAKWSAEAERMMKEPPESLEMEAARFQSSAYNARKTAEENAQTEHDSVEIDAKITDPKVLEKIRKRAEKEKIRTDKLVAGYEKRHVVRNQDLEDWTTDGGSSAQPGGVDNLTRIAVGGGFKRGVDKAIDKIGDGLDERAGKKLAKNADGLDEFKVEMRAAKQALKEQENLEKGQRMLDKAEGRVMSPNEFNNLMKAGKLRARAEELEREVEETVEPGLGERAGVEFKNTVGEQLDKIEQEMAQLKPLVESTKLGKWPFGFKLKINSEGYITNLPGHDEELAIQDLMKEKERLGKKGDTEGVNKIVDQIEALERYPNLLVERDKLLAGSGSTTGPRSMVVGGVWPGRTPRTR